MKNRAKGWKNCWGGLTCFSPRRREKYQGADIHLASGPMSVQSPVENGSLALDFLNKVAILPPVMGAPPSSPVSLGGKSQTISSRTSLVTLHTMFPENSERLDSELEQQFDAISMDAHSGLFMLDNTLVTPPIYSNLTTASGTPLSTAPFTPPPELAHLTTPSSPEVPFAQLLGPSLELHGSLSDKLHEHLSLQSFPQDNLETMHPLNTCSSFGQFAPEMEKGSTNADVLNDRSVCTFGGASFEGFHLLTSEAVLDKPVIMEQVLQHKTKNSGLLEQGGSHSPIRVHDDSVSKYWHDKQNIEECCASCGELLARCMDLSEALEQTKRKLNLVERRVNSIDEREKKFKQLMHWMHLGAKLQQHNSSFQLSKELAWQAVFSDLQEMSFCSQEH